jgi:hypothetical protein
VDAERPDAGDEILDVLRGMAAVVDPVPAGVRGRIHAAFVLSSLESDLSGAVGGPARPLPPPPRNPV